MRLQTTALFFTGALSAIADAQEMQHTEHTPRSHRPPATKPMALMGMKMEMKKCLADMAAVQAKVAGLIVDMNARQGSEKANATRVVVTEMVRQEAEMGMVCMMMGSMRAEKPMSMAGMKGMSGMNGMQPMMEMAKCKADM